MNAFEKVTAKLIETMEQGNCPWRRPWRGIGSAINWQSGKPYRGINRILLEPGEYATFNQIKAAGGSVVAGSKGSLIVFWKFLDGKQDEETGKLEPGHAMLRYYYVFRVGDQTTDLERKRDGADSDNAEIADCEHVVARYLADSGPSLDTSAASAFYRIDNDSVHVPSLAKFEDSAHYYATLFHELGHSTGAQRRLDRFSKGGPHRFGSDVYSREELVAEMTAQYVADACGIDNASLHTNAAGYLQSWIRVLAGDSRLAIMASSAAQKAANLILGIQPHAEAAEE